jgi:hypothetical protein
VKASPFKDDDDADGPQTHITIFQPPMPGAVKLLLERLEYTSNFLGELAGINEGDEFHGMALEIVQANKQMCETLFGVLWKKEKAS